MKSTYPIVLKRGEKLSINTAKIILKDITASEQIFYTEHRRPWNITTKIVGLVVSMNFETGDRIIHGYRSMFSLRQSGYEMDGKISLNGKKVSCFTSSNLFELDNGHLINVQTIFPRLKR